MLLFSKHKIYTFFVQKNQEIQVCQVDQKIHRHHYYQANQEIHHYQEIQVTHPDLEIQVNQEILEMYYLNRLLHLIHQHHHILLHHLPISLKQILHTQHILHE